MKRTPKVLGSSKQAAGRPQEPGLELPADTAEWVHGNWQGQATQLTYDAGSRSWQRGEPTPVSWTPPVEVEGSTLYRYGLGEGRFRVG